MNKERLKVFLDYSKLSKIICLLLLGVVLPFFITEDLFNIYNHLHDAAMSHDFSYIMLAGIKLLAMNCLRTAPVYLGVFLICESLHIIIKGKEIFSFKGLLSIPMLVIFYKLVEYSTGIRYSFGVPAVIVTLFITILINWNLFPVSLISQMMVIAVVVFTTQLLTIHPALDKYGFGQGEIAHDIKGITELLGYDHPLAFFSISLFASFLCISLIMIKLLKDEYRLQLSFQERTKMLQQLSDSRIENLKLRTYGEMRSIMHDLKTPLATIQGLSSLSEIIDDNSTVQEYQNRIGKSADIMSQMISETLYENQKRNCSTSTLLKNIASCLSPNTSLSKMIVYHNLYPEGYVNINVIRMIRAVVNVLENAQAACMRSQKEHSKIELIVDRFDQRIRLQVIDNGDGISENQLDSVWTAGYSSRQSTGLGLAFVKNVIDVHNGQIFIESKENQYTKVTILLEEVIKDANSTKKSADSCNR